MRAPAREYVQYASASARVLQAVCVYVCVSVSVCVCVFVCMYEVQKRVYDVRFAVSDTFGNVRTWCTPLDVQFTPSGVCCTRDMFMCTQCDV